MLEKIAKILKDTRLKKHLTLEEVSKRTHIHPKVLQKIEKADSEGISPVYLRGLIKIYAEFLEVDIQEHLDELTPPKRPSVAYLPRIRAPIIQIIKKTKFKKIALSIFILLLLVSISRYLINKRDLFTQAKPKESKKISLKLKPQEKIHLGIRAKEDCWLQVKVDGRLLYQDTLRKGQVETWTAKERIELWVGNAGGIELEFNGKLFSKLGRRGEVIKNITITKKGLSIKR